ncbi:hypothetical protein GCM10027053_43120 [Intrasporangium mesophilum]
MPAIGFENLLIVVVVALAAPLLVSVIPRVRLPAVVMEIVAGVVLGPAVLGVAEADLAVQVMAVIGLAFLLFMVGLELDVRVLRGTVLRLAALGYLLSLALGGGVGLAVTAAGWVQGPLLIAIALSATSLGLVVPCSRMPAGSTRLSVGSRSRRRHWRMSRRSCCSRCCSPREPRASVRGWCCSFRSPASSSSSPPGWCSPGGGDRSVTSC